MEKNLNIGLVVSRYSEKVAPLKGRVAVLDPVMRELSGYDGQRLADVPLPVRRRVEEALEGWSALPPLEPAADASPVWYSDVTGCRRVTLSYVRVRLAYLLRQLEVAHAIASDPGVRARLEASAAYHRVCRDNPLPVEVEEALAGVLA